MGAALVGMVVELTRGRLEAAEHAAGLEDIGDEAARLRSELLRLTDLDADAYDAVVTARRLPKDTDERRTVRAARIVEATREATRAPLSIGRAALAVLALAERVAPIGNRNAISDVGVAALLAVAAAEGAALNVRINVPFLPEDDPLRADAGREIAEITSGLADRAEALRRLVEGRMG